MPSAACSRSCAQGRRGARDGSCRSWCHPTRLCRGRRRPSQQPVQQTPSRLRPALLVRSSSVGISTFRCKGRALPLDWRSIALHHAIRPLRSWLRVWRPRRLSCILLDGKIALWLSDTNLLPLLRTAVTGPASRQLLAVRAAALVLQAAARGILLGDGPAEGRRRRRLRARGMRQGSG